MAELIELIKYIFLGLFHGVTEPIPVSSSGHLVIVRSLMDLNLPGISFEAFINFGSLIAVIAVYRRELISLAVNGSRFLFQKDQTYTSDFYYLFLLAIATIPAGLIGFLLNDAIGETFS